MDHVNYIQLQFIENNEEGLCLMSQTLGATLTHVEADHMQPKATKMLSYPTYGIYRLINTLFRYS